MAQIINIGNQSNDGTGDSIRDAFKKVNENFQELYGVNNLGAGLFFTKLKDTPKNLIASSTTTPAVIISDYFGNTLTQKLLVAGEGITISNTASGVLTIGNSYSSLITDVAPKLGGNLNAQGYRGINFGDPVDPQDLTTKNYVDNNSPYSRINFYVSLNGRDTFPPDVPPSKYGRSLAYAFRTINKACQAAEAQINTSTIELSQYQQNLTLNNGATTATVYSSTSTLTITNGTRVFVNYGVYAGTDQYILENIRPGQYLYGQLSGTLAFIADYGHDSGFEYYDVQILQGYGFVNNEPLAYSYEIPKTQITICVESGEYYEQLPIRVPANTSIRGDEFRRVVVKPAPGISTSKWANIYFRRDDNFDGLTRANNNGTANLAPAGQLFGYHYLTDPSDPNSTPRLNSQMDVFLMNDATILRAFSVHNHGGFMCVHDPEGQILTKSPYIQNCSSFTQSTNTKQFSGGVYADGFVGNLLAQSVDSVTYWTGTTTVSIVGLQRSPQTPNAFYVGGNRYEIDYFTTGTGAGTGILHLNPRNAGGIAYPGGVIPINTGSGYNYAPLVIFSTPNVNGGYPAQGIANLSGGAIASVTVTNPGSGYTTATTATITFVGGNPLVAASTFSIPANRLATGYIGILPANIEIGTAGNKGMLSADFTQINDLGYGMVGTNNAYMECVSVFSYYNQVSYYSRNGANIRSLNGSSVYGDYALVAEGSDPNQVALPVYLSTDMVQTATVVSYNYTAAGINAINTSGSTQIFVRNYNYVPYNSSQIDVDHGTSLDSTGNPLGLQTYNVVSASTVTGGASIGIPDLAVLYLSNANIFGSTSGGLKAPITSGTVITVRSSDVTRFTGINPSVTFSGAPALQYLDNTGTVYHILAYDQTDMPSGDSKVTTQEDFNYVTLQTYNTTTNAGSTTIPIFNLDTTSTSRVLSHTGTTITQMTFAWKGGIYRVTNYQSSSTIHQPYAQVTIDRVLGSTITNASGSASVPLYAGQRAYTPAQITNAISLLRVTNHDLVDVGFGSYYQSRIPSNVFGPSQLSAKPANERVQVGTGRVFAVTNDQDGNFKVGDYFQVDQGSGNLTIKASLNLTQVSGLGFKQGVVVTKFDQDDKMLSGSNTAVPTQQAVVNYISYRLGLNQNGSAVTKIGPGYLDLTGVQSMAGSIDMAGHKIGNLSSSTLGGTLLEAVNKGYADTKISLTGVNTIDPATGLGSTASGVMTGALQLFRDPISTDDGSTAATRRFVDKLSQVSALHDVNFAGPLDTDFVMFNSTTIPVNTTSSTPVWNTTTQITNTRVTPTSDIKFTRTTNTVAVTIVANTITNAQINSAAAIDQSKLNMQSAGTLSTSSGITQSNRGLAAFDQYFFNTNNGFVTLQTSTNFSIVARQAAATTATLTIGSYLTGNNFNGSANTTWAVDASSANQVSKVVVRDSSGNFATNQITVASIAKSGSSGVGDIGSSGNTFGTVYATTFNGTATKAQYADLAENYLADASYEPGTVVEFGGSAEVTLAEDSTRRVAGVVSTNPAHLMNSQLTGDTVVAVALTGRVPCKVRGSIRKGDMMVSGGDGYARPEQSPLLGSIIGKALEDFNGVSGIIEIVVGRL